MPATKVLLYRDDDDSVPLLDWLAELESRDRAAYRKCRRYLLRLAQVGNELRRPVADYLRDGIYELRVRHSRVNYRMLYGFVGNNVVLVSHGITKERLVPASEIELALRRLAQYRNNPNKYSFDDDEE
ncbi:MAG TPA: type II toxin-antitoxin system RelE/ParE family toxin [Lacipirellulaceae bacterium]|nr:type II toxin-antitoxin system RelE/ParE family toxin [Lacipirellulaceae bacterium]